MRAENPFITTNQLSFIDHSKQKLKHRFNPSLNKSVVVENLNDEKLIRNKSQAVCRNKSPIMKAAKRNEIDIMAAGVQRMNPTLYSQPWKNGSKNQKFKHPNLASNIVFYETTPNMKNIGRNKSTQNLRNESQFLTTSQIMSSLANDKFSTENPMIRSFMINGKVSERFTRKNNSNFKNNSSFMLSHDGRAKEISVNHQNKRNKSFIQEVEEPPRGHINIWRYKDSPYGKTKEETRPQTAKNATSEDLNLFRKVRKVQKAAFDVSPQPDNREELQVNDTFSSKPKNFQTVQVESKPIQKVDESKFDSEVPPSAEMVVVPETPRKKQNPDFENHDYHKPKEDKNVVV
jgi:hypothetical protein